MDALVRPSFPLVIGKWQKDSSRDYLPLENLGEVESRGWEINLAWRDQIGQVKYRAFFNLSDARNKIIDLGSSAPVLGDQIRRVGDPIDAYYGYRTDGLHKWMILRKRQFRQLCKSEVSGDTRRCCRSAR